MDFRAMLKKRKYAKWGKDKEDPDWGTLKEVEEPPKPQLKKVERVSSNLTAIFFSDVRRSEHEEAAFLVPELRSRILLSLTHQCSLHSSPL
jgi:hypothetical protein